MFCWGSFLTPTVLGGVGAGGENPPVTRLGALVRVCDYNLFR
jgi:hypothetical protein